VKGRDLSFDNKSGIYYDTCEKKKGVEEDNCTAFSFLIKEMEQLSLGCQKNGFSKDPNRRIKIPKVGRF